jgi:hypothetical protein
MKSKKFKKQLTEEDFNQSLPKYLLNASSLYFTPINVAEQAVDWLTKGGQKRVLDIGAGIGKFCIAGARLSDSFFCGIEYRPSLVAVANQLISKFEVPNAAVYHANITDVSFGSFDGFYLYNPFTENLIPEKRLNMEVPLSIQNYDTFIQYTWEQFSMALPGTRVVSFHGNNFELPEDYYPMDHAFYGRLKLWVKQ